MPRSLLFYNEEIASAHNIMVVIHLFKSLARRNLLGLGLGLAFILMLPHLASSILINHGSLILVRATINPEGGRGTYPHWEVRPKSISLDQALESFALASTLDPSSATVQWGYGRAALAAGKAGIAAAALQVGTPQLLANKLRFLDTLVAHSRAEDDSGVLALYKQGALNTARKRMLSDAVALVYLGEARRQIETGNSEAALSDLRQVLTVRPFDLYANYYLWHHASQTGDSEETATYYRQLLYFPTEAVTADDERLLEYVFGIVPQLLSNDLWGAERSSNVMAYWVWQYPESSALKSLLQSLVKDLPDDARWSFYLGELYHRLGQVDLAEQYYQLAIRAEVNYGPAQTRLAQLVNKEPTTHLPPTGTSLQDTKTVAQLLGVPTDTVRLGSNLVEGDTSISTAAGFPNGWFNGVFGGAQGRAFAFGRDPIERKGSIRITNLWWPAVDSDPKFTSFAEYGGVTRGTSAPWLMMGLWYKTEGKLSDTGFVLLGNRDGVNYMPRFVHTSLPDTSGRWVRLVVVGKTPSLDSSLFILLRNSGVANIWFQDVEVRSIDVSVIPTHCAQTPCISFSQPPGQ